MDAPKVTSMILAGEWVSHLTNEAAWDEMNDVVETDPERAWRLIRAVVGVAPDDHTLSALAAGPVEDFIDRHGDEAIAMMTEEIRKSARLRVCLRGAYSELPDELRSLIEGESSDVRDLATDPTVSLDSEDLALILAWLRHSNTAWAADFLKEMTEHDPAAAWDVLRVLAVFAQEDSRIQLDIFDDAFEPFIRQHFTAYREQLIDLGQKRSAFRQWVHERKDPVTTDAATWAAFAAELLPA